MYLTSCYFIIMKCIKFLLFNLRFHKDQHTIYEKYNLPFTFFMYLLNLLQFLRLKTELIVKVFLSLSQFALLIVLFVNLNKLCFLLLYICVLVSIEYTISYFLRSKSKDMIERYCNMFVNFLNRIFLPIYRKGLIICALRVDYFLNYR
jgi:hypothetical protein